MYRLTRTGARHLDAAEERWLHLTRAVGKVLRFA
jgi:hypothetical protein